MSRAWRWRSPCRSAVGGRVADRSAAWMPHFVVSGRKRSWFAGPRKPERKPAMPDRVEPAVPTYQVLVDDLKALGVEQVFGLMSDDTAVFATALDSSGIRFYGARHENNAIAMAEGYAYGTGGLGVAVIGRGPATANGLHATTYASRSGSRVLIIFGEQAASSGAVNTLGPDYKGFNSTGVLGAAGIRTFVATSPETARGALADAAAAALQGGAAALLLPVNVQLATMDLADGAAAPAPKRSPPAPAAPRPQAIDSAVALVRQ